MDTSTESFVPPPVPLFDPVAISLYSDKSHCIYYPRSRGEHTQHTARQIAEWGSSPLTRGARRLLRRGEAHAGLIPAHAGST